MKLDINTPKGRESLAQERILLKSFTVATNLGIVETDKSQPAQIDGFIVRDDTVVGMFESKCRKATVEQMNRWGDEWLITYQKLLDGAELSKRLRIPFYGIVYLLDEPLGFFIQLTDSEGNFVPKIRTEETKTQATINGGTAVRLNAYVDISNCSTFPIV